MHIRSPGNIFEYQTLVRTLLSTIATKRFESVSIPPIGVSRGIPLQQVADCITDEVASAACGKSLGLLQRVRFVGFNQNEKDAFERALNLSAPQTSALDAAKSNSSATQAAIKNGRCKPASHVGPDGRKAEFVSDSYATVGHGLHRGSKAVHFEWENAKENLLYSKPYALCAISTGEVGYGEGVRWQVALQK